MSTTVLTGWMPTLLRMGRGMTRYEGATAGAGGEGGGGEDGARRGMVPLTLYNYEGNQFARLAREALCELELPYGRGGKKSSLCVSR